MFSALRSLFQGLKGARRAQETRQRLFREQNALARDLHQAMQAYERRLAYLQSELLRLSDDDVASGRALFDEAHRSLARVLSRLQAADQEAETLVREWRDWHDHHDPSALPREAGERLEVLRSELAARGLLSPAERGAKTAAAPPKPRRAASSYVPTSLSDDALSVFDRVFAARVRREADWLDRRWRSALSVGGQPAWQLWLTRRRKRLHGWKKRLKTLVP